MSAPVFVTGGAGFIGSALVRALVQDGVRVVTLDALTYAGNCESLADAEHHPLHTFAHIDIADRDAVRSAFEQHQPSAVYHLAAESHVDRSIEEPLAFVRTNVVGTAVLLDEALRYWRALPPNHADAFRFLHVSTDEVFGSLGASGRFSAESPYDPSSPYSASKAGSDHLVRAWQRTYAFPVLITNCSNNYGPYQFPEKLIPLTILHALEGKPLPVYGTGSNVRDWLYVEDHVAALRTVMQRGTIGQTYLVGGNAERTNLTVVRGICDLIDERLQRTGSDSAHALITFVTDRPGHDHRYAIDASRLHRDLDWAPTVTFEAGLARTVDWYLTHRTWWERVRSGAYRGERLGLTRAQ